MYNSRSKQGTDAANLIIRVYPNVDLTKAIGTYKEIVRLDILKRIYIKYGIVDITITACKTKDRVDVEFSCCDSAHANILCEYLVKPDRQVSLLHKSHTSLTVTCDSRHRFFEVSLFGLMHPTSAAAVDKCQTQLQQILLDNLGSKDYNTFELIVSSL